MSRVIKTPSPLLACILLITSCFSAFSQPYGPGWANEQVVQKYVLNEGPVALRFLPDARMLILQKKGKIMVCDPINQTLPVQPTLFMQLPNPEFAWDRGALDFILDPGFSNNGHFYVFYNYQYNPTLARFRVSRFTTNTGNGAGTTGNPSSEQVIWEETGFNSLTAPAHHGGSLAFAPDGKLLIGLGHINNQNYPQDTTLYAGKILRLNPDGSIPPDNPLVGNTLGYKPEIFAVGARLAFRTYMDLPTGRFFIADVGKSNINTSWEDIHLIQFPVPGNSSIIPDSPLINLGYPMHEGYTPPLSPGNYPPGFQEPLFTYPHAGSTACIIGGFVYRGTMLPAHYYGTYFFADYNRGEIHYLTFQPNGTVKDSIFAVASDPTDPNRNLQFPVCLEEGPDGAIYYAQWSTAEVRRIRYNTGTNQPPVCGTPSATLTHGSGSTLTTAFSAGNPSDPNGDSLSYHWLFGDGTDSNLPNPTHTYNGTGTYTAQLIISDGVFNTTCGAITITLGDPPTAQILAPSQGHLFSVGDTLLLRGSGTDLQDGNLPGSQLEWEIILNHNDHTHPGTFGLTGDSARWAIPTGHSFSENTGFTVILTATDSDGLTAIDSVRVNPRKVNFTFKTIPPGLSILVDGGPVRDGEVWDEAVGYPYTASTPLSQCSGGSLYVFDHWSSGATRTHSFNIPAVDDTLTAYFTTNGQSCNDCQHSVGQGLLARYQFNEHGGNVIHDVSGVSPSLDLLLEDSTKVTWVEGGLRFDSATRAVSIAPDSKIYNACRASQSLTVEAWVQPSSIAQTGPATLVSLSAHPGDRNFMVGQRSDGVSGRWTSFLRTSSGGGNGAPEFDPQNWGGFSSAYRQHVVYTRDSIGKEALYVNGVQVENGLRTGNMAASWAWQNTAYLYLGMESTPVNPWQSNYPWLGTLYQLSIYGRALDSAEVQQNFNAGCGLPLTATFPVELAGFEAQRSGGAVLLDWITLNELNSDHFEVQRAGKDGEFTSIGKVEAAMHSQVEKSYQFVDALPAFGLNYYRLRMVDLDGEIELSPVREVYFGEGSYCYVFPNPVKEWLTLRSAALTQYEGSFRLLDLTGRQVLILQLLRQDDDLLQVSLEELPAGVYFYELDLGLVYFSGKVMKE